MRWVDDRLAIGDASDAMGVGALEQAGITGVLSLDWFPLSSPSPGLDWRKRPLIDGAGNSPEVLRSVIVDLQELLQRCPRVLVHCREGVSRSPFVVACYLASTTMGSFGAAREFVTERVGWVAINEGLVSTWERLATGAEDR